MLTGMPNIAGLVTATTNAAIGLGGALLVNAIFGKTWGIVNEFGVPIVLADSVVGMSYDAGNTISNFPVEKGSFSSYNKVNNPSIATVQMNKSSGGTLERGLFLTQLEILLKSTLKFHVITPEYVYMNYQIIGINHSRGATDGATLLKVNLDLQEVLEATVEYATEEVTEPSDAAQKDGGAQQAKPVRTSIASDIAEGKITFGSIFGR